MAIIIDRKKDKIEDNNKIEDVSSDNTENNKNWIEVKLGPRKSVFITPWKAKAKKEFIKIFKKNGDKTTEEDILNILLYPYLKDNIYLSSAELQYVLFKLREISIRNKEVEFVIDCNSCGEEIEIKTDISDLVHYKETLIPIEKNGNIWRDPESNEIVKQILFQYKDEPPTVLMIGLHLKKYRNRNIESLEEFLEIYDDLDMVEVENLEDEWYEVSSNFEIYKKIKCDKCDYETTYSFDIIPGFFDPLLPK